MRRHCKRIVFIPGSRGCRVMKSSLSVFLRLLIVATTLLVGTSLLFAASKVSLSVFSRTQAEKTARELLQSQVCIDVLNKERKTTGFGYYWKDPSQRLILFGETKSRTDACGSMAILTSSDQHKKAVESLEKALKVLTVPSQKIVAGDTLARQISTEPFKEAVKIIRGLIEGKDVSAADAAGG